VIDLIIVFEHSKCDNIDVSN